MTNNREISNEFCRYFTDIWKNLGDKIDKVDKSYDTFLNLKKQSHNSIFLQPCTEQEIMKIIFKT